MSIAALLLSLAAAQDAPAAAEAASACPFSAGVRLTLWLGDYSFESRSTTEDVELDAVALAAGELYGVLDLSPEWAVELGVETALSDHVSAFSGALSGLYRLDFLGEDVKTYLKAGLVAGGFDLDDAPGDFETSVGVQGGAGGGIALSPSLSLNVEAKLRYLEYDFDEDANFVETDRSIGGVSFGLSAGLSLRF